jgi:predicted PurR-regulated permease PerM
MMSVNDKNKYSTITKWVITIAVIAIVVWCIWYFRFLVGCIFIALVLSLIGRPIMDFLEKIKYKKLHLNKAFCAAITLIFEIFIIGTILYFLVPMIISQAMSFSNIDIYKIAGYYSEPIKKIEHALYTYNLLPQSMSLETYVSGKIMAMMNSFKLPTLAASILSIGGNIVMGFFIVAFITFFFLKDSHIVNKFIDSITPDKYLDEVHKIILNSRKLISRYFVGVFIEILFMILLLSIGFSIFGFNNAILIACICGVMVILPYIGVIIGGGFGLMVLITSYLSVNPSTDIVPIILQFVLVFIIAKLIDDFLMQPLIYSKSVKAKPLEIFLVILMAGKIGGVLGMVLAIPVYTFLRIIAKEFFNKWKFIKALTKEID